jgi:hypothetical protein
MLIKFHLIVHEMSNIFFSNCTEMYQLRFKWYSCTEYILLVLALVVFMYIFVPFIVFCINKK